jgi:response regulator RpfG family c-di-GMP phosphodiesterase
MADPVLFVDDEANVLEGISRSLHNRLELRTASSGAEALRILASSGPYAVIVSDMRMPEMNGVQFLAKARELYPDTVRIILSGQSDLSATIAAVNEGNIFRFLSKPCVTQVLLAAVGTGIEQYHLVTAEKVLLEQTLTGAVGMLLEILGMVTPAAYGRALRLQRNVSALAAALSLRPQWQWPLAALVSQIGCISLPNETLSKVEAGQALTEEEQLLYRAHPQLAARMLEAIPRLEDVAAIVNSQNVAQSRAGVAEDPLRWDVRTAGIVLLHAASQLDAQLLKGRTPTTAAEAMKASGSELPRIVIEAIALLPAAPPEYLLRQLRLRELAPGMFFDEALVTRRGVCLVPAGREITAALLLRLRSIAAGVPVREPMRVRIPV